MSQQKTVIKLLSLKYIKSKYYLAYKALKEDKIIKKGKFNEYSFINYLIIDCGFKIIFHRGILNISMKGVPDDILPLVEFLENDLRKYEIKNRDNKPIDGIYSDKWFDSLSIPKWINDMSINNLPTKEWCINLGKKMNDLPNEEPINQSNTEIIADFVNKITAQLAFNFENIESYKTNIETLFESIDIDGLSALDEMGLIQTLKVLKAELIKSELYEVASYINKRCKELELNID